MYSRQFFRIASRAVPHMGRRFSSMKAIQNKSKSPIMAVTLTGVVGLALYNTNKAEAATSDFSAVKKDITDAIEADAEKRSDGTSVAGTLIRLAWHHSGTYSKVDGSGGSGGACMRFPGEKDWGANAGLGIARDFMEQFKKKYPNMSYSDLWVLAGCVAIEQMGGPEVPFRSGRADSNGPTTVPDGRLPAADSGCVAADVAHLRDIFYRMGFDDKDIVCLAGAHCVGRCHTDASGYWGPWTNAETTFSNEYFRLLIEEKWTLKKTHNGRKWNGPAQYENKDGTLMMLPADMTLSRDSAFRKYVEMYAKDEELFFKDFVKVWTKLTENGVNFDAKPKGFLSGILSFFK